MGRLPGPKIILVAAFPRRTPHATVYHALRAFASDAGNVFSRIPIARQIVVGRAAQAAAPGGARGDSPRRPRLGVVSASSYRECSCARSPGCCSWAKLPLGLRRGLPYITRFVRSHQMPAMSLFVNSDRPASRGRASRTWAQAYEARPPEGKRKIRAHAASRGTPMVGQGRDCAEKLPRGRALADGAPGGGARR